MSISSGDWYPVLSGHELLDKPLAKMRFGLRMVFWRDRSGRAVGMPNCCPHRGAELSLGRICGDSIACPFHGIEFDRSGRCTRIPTEGNSPISDSFRIQPFLLHEAHGYIWLWRGSVEPDGKTPQPINHQELDGLSYGESRAIWPAHYTRCVESVCDYSHMSFVHRGIYRLFRSRSDAHTVVNIENINRGFRAYLDRDPLPSKSIEFLYPCQWLMRPIGSPFHFSIVFSPVDDERTEAYVRAYCKANFPGIRFLMRAVALSAHYFFFQKDDFPIIAGQYPLNSADAVDEKLLPSDAPVIEYRKLHMARRSLRNTS